jgi:hypothetical protein
MTPIFLPSTGVVLVSALKKRYDVVRHWQGG